MAEANDKPQVVLVLQGGGALGAYQAGVYQALAEGGIAPDWVIGTSIGAINAALIVGNAPDQRLARMREFWTGLARAAPMWPAWCSAMLDKNANTLATFMGGLPGFFRPNPFAGLGLHAPLGTDRAALYTTDPLAATLGRLVDFERLNRGPVRLTVGAVNVRTGDMRYFDSRDQPIAAPHVMASGALPPAFPAVRIDGEPYWDGGVYSNTPIEVVLDDRPRRNSLIFSVNMWQPGGDEPQSIWEVLARQKDIQYSSRGKSHVARQEQIHRLRHVVRELAKRIPESERDDPMVRELASYGCGTVMHLVRLLAPRLDGEDHMKDIDFTRAGIGMRWEAGYEHAQRVLAQQPWETAGDMLQGIVVHEAAAAAIN